MRCGKMKFTEQIKGLISRGEIQEASTNMLEDTINAVLGDPISIGKIIKVLTELKLSKKSDT